ncbi:hypothetical protein PTKIN_Ptkin08bG0070100 [Pterospermum kingtungense]
MRNLSILIPTFILLFLLQHIATCEQIYTPPDNIALDCGTSTSGTYAAPDGRKWTGDKDSKFGLIEDSSTKSVSTTALTQHSSVHWVPYLTARLSKSQFIYMFPVTVGQKFIRLHFYPAHYQGFDRHDNFFSVKVGPYTLLSNFSASFTADYLEEASFVKEFCVNLEQKQSQQTHFQIDNYTALENVHRLNIGGRSISAAGDTGTYRNWYDDFFYLVAAVVVPSNTSIKLDYSKIPEYTAPEDVYRKLRSMGSNRTENLAYNLTWRLPVDSGFRYHVRLHFCEFDPSVEAVSDRRFRIYIDNQTAEEAFDVIEVAGGKGIPIYNDYVVMIGNIGDKTEHTLFIASHPNNLYSAYADSLLNGLEVFKLNNSDGNLAGLNPLPTMPTAGVEQSKKMQRNGSQYKGKSSRPKSSSLPDALCHHFSLDEIKAATSDFHEALVIGVGGFGNVHKGFLDEGETIVAIKRLNPESRQGAREFKTEIEMLSELRHIHMSL